MQHADFGVHLELCGLEPEDGVALQLRTQSAGRLEICWSVQQATSVLAKEAVHVELQRPSAAA